MRGFSDLGWWLREEKRIVGFPVGIVMVPGSYSGSYFVRFLVYSKYSSRSQGRDPNDGPIICALK